MKANFDISLPSIPGKTIKFKIQDIKSAAFGTQKARFSDDKSQLVKKFVDSFHNFHEPKQNDETETEADTELSRSYVTDKPMRSDMKFRNMIPENKKFLLPLYNQLKKQQKMEEKVTKGYTFNKFEQREERMNPNQQKTGTKYLGDPVLTDNYYFTRDQILYETDDPEKKQAKPKPSAIFKNQTRKRVYDRLQHSIVPGPGAYLKDSKTKKSNSKKKNTAKLSIKDKNNKELDYNHLKQLIAKVIAEEPEQEEETVQMAKEKRNDHMFILDDRDRFGEQKFPIAPKLKVPGPGSYTNNNSIEDRMKKLVVVEEQRKLLKQWFNN